MSTAQIRVTPEPTPNPSTMSFRFSQKLLDRTLSFESSGETESSPLAAKIFGFPWTSRVFLGEDFVAVTKQDWVDWEVLAEPLSGLIQEHLNSGLPVFIETTPEEEEGSEDDTELTKRIKALIKREIKPVVAMDGGDVAFVKYTPEDGKLMLRFKGACSGCASQAVTLKEGIEVRMREEFPEIQEVLSV